MVSYQTLSLASAGGKRKGEVGLSLAGRRGKRGTLGCGYKRLRQPAGGRVLPFPRADSHSSDTSPASGRARPSNRAEPPPSRVPNKATRITTTAGIVSQQIKEQKMSLFSQWFFQTLLLSPVTVATATSPRTEGPQSRRGHAKRSAHLQL